MLNYLRKKKKRKKNSPELQKPNVQAEVYNNKNVTEKKNKKKNKLKSLIRFHNANEINNYNKV